MDPWNRRWELLYLLSLIFLHPHSLRLPFPPLFHHHRHHRPPSIHRPTIGNTACLPCTPQNKSSHFYTEFVKSKLSPPPPPPPLPRRRPPLPPCRPSRPHPHHVHPHHVTVVASTLKFLPHPCAPSSIQMSTV